MDLIALALLVLQLGPHPPNGDFIYYFLWSRFFFKTVTRNGFFNRPYHGLWEAYLTETQQPTFSIFLFDGFLFAFVVSFQICGVPCLDSRYRRSKKEMRCGSRTTCAKHPGNWCIEEGINKVIMERKKAKDRRQTRDGSRIYQTVHHATQRPFVPIQSFTLLLIFCYQGSNFDIFSSLSYSFLLACSFCH